MLIERADFAVDDAIGQMASFGDDFGKARAPVERLARAHRCAPFFDAQLQAIPVEFYLVHPHRAHRRSID